MIKNQARMDARFNAKFDRAEERFAQAEKRLDRLERAVTQNNRLVTQLARAGVSLRSDVRRAAAESEKRFSHIEENLASVSEKLNALIDIVDGHIRGNGHRHGA